MVRHEVPFQYVALPLSGQLSKDLAQIPPKLLEKDFPPALWNPYHVVLAGPPGVAWTLMLIHTKASLSVNFERFTVWEAFVYSRKCQTL